MNKELYVSSTPHETRLALAEDGEVAEVYYEREQEYSLAGAIFKGRVTRVLPGMQSAFVDIGLERDAFLYVSDFFEDSEEYDRVVSEAENAVARLDRPAPAVAAVEAGEGGDAAAPEAPFTAAGETVAAPIIVPPAPPPSGGARAAAGENDDRPARRGGRHRRGGRNQRNGFPESKFARPDDAALPADRPAERAERAPERPAAPRPEAPAANAGHTAAYPAMVLPGESLAKYRDRPADAPTSPAQEWTPSHAADAAARHAAPEEAPAAPGEEQSREEFEHERMQPDAPRHQFRHDDADAGDGVEPPAGAAAELEIEVDLEDEGSQAASDENGELDGDDIAGEFESVDEEDAADDDGRAAESLAESGHPAAPEAGDEADEEGGEEAGAADAASVGQAPSPARLQAPSPAGQAGQEGGRGRRHRRRRGGRGPREGMLREGATREGTPREAGPREGRSSEAAPRAAAAGPRTIAELLHAGQEILVQISKEPIGKKGARITSHLALPGRFLVYMPTVHHIGVSRKIGSDEERARLKRFILEQSKDLPGGFIVRTAAASATDEELAGDVRLLANLWNDIRQQFEASRSPANLHHDLNLVERTLRDQLSEEFTHIWVDTDEMYQRVVKFVSYFMPQLSSRVRLYTREQPLFEHFGVQEEIDKALKSKVWLKSGGYIVLNQTEALVAIDVNTGKYVGRSNRLEDTIVKTNVDAIQEIVRQIRLRDLGGIIVIDFIDMDERRNRQRVMQALEEAMRADRAPSKVLSFNDFGLVALTRKRVKQSLERTLGCACPYCEGVGLVKSPVTVCNEIYLEARKVAPTVERDDMVLRVNPEVARLLKSGGAARLRELETLTGKAISVRPDPAVHQQQFEIY